VAEISGNGVAGLRAERADAPAERADAPDAAAPVNVAAPVTGYSLVLPPGWRRIPVQHGTKAAIRGIVDEVLRRYPKDMPRDKMTHYRIEIERHLSDLARRARSSGGVDLYLPIEYVHGVTITASFVVSQVTLPVPDTVTDEQVATGSAELVAYLTSAEGNASPVSVAGGPAARTESVAPADPGEQMAFGSRRVDYVIPLPGHPTRWMLAAFSTIGDGDPAGQFAKLLVELFDAVMMTFRWNQGAQ